MNRCNIEKFVIVIILISFILGGSFSFGKLVKAQEEDVGQIKKLRILYQGILSDSQGNPIEDGKYNIRFRIYDQHEEGNILWEEEHVFYNAIFIKNGNLKILLGRNNLINLDLSQVPFWLSISIGDTSEDNQIVWQEEMCPRKKITTLSEVLGEEELTPEQWENLSKLIKERLGDETNVVILFDIEQLENINYSEDGGISKIDSRLFNIFQDLTNFLSEKIGNIEQALANIGEKIDIVLSKLEDIIYNLANMKSKIDILYDVLVVKQGLVPEEPASDYQITGKAVISQGAKVIKIVNSSIKENSLVFIAFSDEENILWKASKDVSEKSFSVILENPAEQDLNFEYWIMDRSEEKSEIEDEVVEANQEIETENEETENEDLGAGKEELDEEDKNEQEIEEENNESEILNQESETENEEELSGRRKCSGKPKRRHTRGHGGAN